MTHRTDTTVARDSMVLRALERTMEHGVAAWRTSRLRAAGQTVLHTASIGSDPVALAGWMALGAAAMRLLLAHGRVSVYSSSAAGFGWLALIPFAVVCIWRPAAVRAAWRSSRLLKGRLGRAMSEL